jgi:hypothetical protein
VTADYSKHVRQFSRDSGRQVRRSAKIHDTSSTVSEVISGNTYPFPGPNSPISGGQLTRDTITSSRCWFKGAFTYYLPPPDTPVQWFERYESYAHRLFGLRIDPDLLWKLAPWSWAVDWVTNTGSVIRNWSAFQNDGLVMHYGYVMEEKRKEVIYNLTATSLRGGYSTPALTDKVTYLTKSRRGATPYGFGLNPASFTPKQASIISALGINRWAGRR